jgi:hypothetical protein
MHRYVKAIMEEKKTIKVYLIDKTILNKCLLDRHKNWEKLKKIPVHKYIEMFYTKFY